MQFMKRSLHKLSIDIRVGYVTSNIQSLREVHIEHRFDDRLNQVKMLGARSHKKSTPGRRKLRVKIILN